MTWPLPPDDRRPVTTTDHDLELRWRLERSTSQHFFEACSGSLQPLLMDCRWSIVVVEALMLEIHCGDPLTNWRVLGRLAAIAHVLAQFSPQAKIRVYPPLGDDILFDPNGGKL